MIKNTTATVFAILDCQPFGKLEYQKTTKE